MRRSKDLKYLGVIESKWTSYTETRDPMFNRPMYLFYIAVQFVVMSWLTKKLSIEYHNKVHNV